MEGLESNPSDTYLNTKQADMAWRGAGRGAQEGTQLPETCRHPLKDLVGASTGQRKEYTELWHGEDNCNTKQRNLESLPMKLYAVGGKGKITTEEMQEKKTELHRKQRREGMGVEVLASNLRETYQNTKEGR